MKPSVDVIAADAGPLIALAKIDGLPLLPAVFTRALVTETVMDECSAGNRPEALSISAAIETGHLVLIQDEAPNTDWNLDAGEASAISAALSRKTGLLIDDRAGRRVASELGIPVIGVLGVLVLAKRLGELPSVRPLIDRLVANGYYLAGPVIQDALRAAGELPDP